MSAKNPNAVALGRLGGASKSAAKADAARANGAKGGRPPKPGSVRRKPTKHPRTPPR